MAVGSFTPLPQGSAGISPHRVPILSCTLFLFFLLPLSWIQTVSGVAYILLSFFEPFYRYTPLNPPRTFNAAEEIADSASQYFLFLFPFLILHTRRGMVAGKWGVAPSCCRCGRRLVCFLCPSGTRFQLSGNEMIVTFFPPPLFSPFCPLLAEMFTCEQGDELHSRCRHALWSVLAIRLFDSCGIGRFLPLPPLFFLSWI